MYDWLSDSLANSATIVTANRRLARTLKEEFNATMQRSGQTAWCSPKIVAWLDWCNTVIAAADDQGSLPTRITLHQSQWLWERCLQKVVADDRSNFVNLVRLSRDMWQRLADWEIPIKVVAAAAQSTDQRLFAAAAGHYLGILERENWVDDAGAGALLLRLISDADVGVVNAVTFAGFDRHRPINQSVQAAIVKKGGKILVTEPVKQCSHLTLQSYENSDSELRAAGAWARGKIEAEPACRVAIVAHGLESNADSMARLVREGLTPGWQFGHPSLHDALNVSFGSRLADFPAISIALLSLRWLVKDLSSIEVGILLRSPLLSTLDSAGRSRLELKLRRMPDRSWTPAMISAALRARSEGGDGSDWLDTVAGLSKRRREVPTTATPAEWALFVDETLQQLNWPGQTGLSSLEYQLLNRWRELLNELARLDLVSARMSLTRALTRLEMIASETVFQPESTRTRVHLMGPLEAAGAEFDALWICGLSSADWPPVAGPSVLVSRRLQERFELPDSTPADTTRYARAVLARLTGCADEVVCSYARNRDDSEQTPSSLLLELRPSVDICSKDPGWHASELMARGSLEQVNDRVPRVSSSEKLTGGAAIIQQQQTEPLSAFVYGRLGARRVSPQAVGIPASLRGTLIHEALYNFYLGLPDRKAIEAWCGSELDARVAAALDAAFARHERQLDAVLKQVFALERDRVAGLLRRFVVIDTARDDFKIARLEEAMELVCDEVRLSLRCDRIDTLIDGSIAILDYKTGAKKRLWSKDREPLDIQLFVYACAADASVAALALVNIDSREIGFDGAGRGYSDLESWPNDLDEIRQQIVAACADLGDGDVRIDKEQDTQSARPLSLLTRFHELRRGDE